ncbi:TIGR02530 family flagellar biosynthesis protein [Jeotgalibacillus sp. R-1-5s-1]|uniref:TIGR02530 family flagellar biosynthesis protein n=1 Tax=Jeotgalibacillus sp. R-1-5s-1 TaxID=2555897 RepID=UPI00106ABBBD|nr:TIGR02530 family flagellar biosynthesis protein [Jeotgalibacillus sp. R-1-5s-1]TFE03493.1 flagellar protein [Jeotgalibacillus sp. R-1-5s-1]
MEHIRFKPLPSPVLPAKKQPPVKSNGFAEAFKQEISRNELKISKHAAERMTSRSINLTQEQWNRVNEKVHEAGEKGIKDSLVLLSDAALIVSIKNRTVVTAMGKHDIHDQIFTDIDGTIILE